MFSLTLVVAALAATVPAQAQIDAQFSQYFEVPSYYNAAAIGNSDMLRIRGGSRLQWIGIPKAPKTFLILADMPFKIGSQRFGVGLVMQQESVGLYKSMNAAAQVGYKRKILGGTLTIGAQVGMLNETFKGSEVKLVDGDDYHEGSDDAIPTTDIHGTAFDVAAGVFFSHRLFWLGVSGTHLTQPSVKMDAEGSTASEKAYEFEAGRTLYFMAGSNIPLKNTLFELQPSLFVKTDLTFFQGEANLRVRYNKFLTGGVGYRYNDAVIATLGAEYKNFFLGYSYDYPLSAVSKASSGSHEVFVGYSLKLDLSDKNKNKHKNIRIM